MPFRPAKGPGGRGAPAPFPALPLICCLRPERGRVRAGAPTGHCEDYVRKDILQITGRKISK
ncbi:hypothetical protein DENIS_4341 [Desulfonema ishimotonii]|uniref:Uncharacterized protein n=1 Tax=Desulfonema ishimotonii TaxID=45657 RepID=A0A401G296_9BACT|nr:hypothetical protein DENIS_4341 [Desulfonema ishimotonii]